MKRLFLVLLTMVFVIGLNAQSRKNKDFYFVYIDHETTTPVDRLCENIKDLRDNALETHSGLVIYLSNGFYPMISMTNLPDASGNYSGDEKFNDIIAALQEENSHDVNPTIDTKKIVEVLAQSELLSNSQSLLWSSATLDFYTGPTFWNLNCNETLLSRLYFALDIPEVQENDELMFNVYKASTQELSVEEKHLFGLKNLQGINKKVRLMNY